MPSGTIGIFLCFCSLRTTCAPNVSLHAQLLADLIRVNAAISLYLPEAAVDGGADGGRPH